MKRRTPVRPTVLSGALITAVGLALAAPAGAYTVEQALGGQAIYEQNCAACHGPNLQGSFIVPALAGRSSRLARDAQNAAQLYELISTRMPQDRPGTLAPDEYWRAAAFILSQNSIEPDGVPLGPETAEGVPILVGGPPINLFARTDCMPTSMEEPTSSVNGTPGEPDVLPSDASPDAESDPEE